MLGGRVKDFKTGHRRGKMKIVQINALCDSGSTGKICHSVSRILTSDGIENYILYSCGNSKDPSGKKFAAPYALKAQSLISHLLGNYGFEAFFTTGKLLKELDKIGPDIIHLHNIHSHDCDLAALFRYIKKNRIKVYWTFHDCWAFTGYCPHFDMIGCEKWKTEFGA